jgi:hypothetical protein
MSKFLREQRDSNSMNGGLRFSRRVKEAQRTLRCVVGISEGAERFKLFEWWVEGSCRGR